MSKQINVIVLEVGETARCESCGKIDELRPYGEGGKRICYECGTKNAETTQRMMDKTLFGSRADKRKQTKRK